ncbi:activator of basal transcription 1-like [Branchiostoma lanceolatum]|uniref:activator of basal transcription 1-like n=1 Tax=Branchiostoma lanceolatum TaxID=7740 RepID=UPI0034570331
MSGEGEASGCSDLETEQNKDEDQSARTEAPVEASDEEEDDDDSEMTEAPASEPGVVYLSHLPPRMNPKNLRHMFSQYGDVGRTFLQPGDQHKRLMKKKPGGKRQRQNFVEGWVEFRDKRLAKRIALSLNNTPIETRRRSPFYGDLWNIKYLHRFKWTHLSEQLAYERAVREQRMRTEILQAKKETKFFEESLEQSKAVQKIEEKKRKKGEEVSSREGRNFKQQKTEEEIRQWMQKKEKEKEKKKKPKSKKPTIENDVMQKIFEGGPALAKK